MEQNWKIPCDFCGIDIWMDPNDPTCEPRDFNYDLYIPNKGRYCFVKCWICRTNRWAPKKCFCRTCFELFHSSGQLFRHLYQCPDHQK